MRSRKEIKELAKSSFGLQRGTSILLVLVTILLGMASGILDTIIDAIVGQGLLYWIVYWVGMLLLWVLTVNLCGEFIKVWKGQRAEVGALFSGFAVNFWRKMGGMAWQNLWLAIWGLPLIIAVIPFYMWALEMDAPLFMIDMPALLVLLGVIGVISITIKSMAYFFAPNILADCPNVSATDSLRLSIRMTAGHRVEIFVFTLSWLGWHILGWLTCGILWVVYVGPYWYTADAGLYLEIKNRALESGVITFEDLGEEEPSPYNVN